MIFNQSQFNQFVLDHGIIKVFDTPITLKSGKQSHVYVNWRTASNDVFLMDRLTDFVLAFAASVNIQPDTFYGVPEGATKLGVITQFKYARSFQDSKGTHALAMGRAKPKDHGDPADRMFVGAPSGRICVLEDVTTTGGSLIACIQELQSLGLNVMAAIGLTNRNEYRDDGKTVTDALSELNVPYHEMSSATTLLANAKSDKDLGG